MDYIRLKYIKIKDNRNDKTFVYSETDSDIKAIGLTDNGTVVLFETNKLAKIIYRLQDDNIISEIKWDMDDMYSGPDLKTLKKQISKKETIGESLEVAPLKTMQALIKETSKRITFHEEVDHPRHYSRGKIECIEYIADKNMNYIVGNIFKYLTRYLYKNNPTKDLKKALKYITFEKQFVTNKRISQDIGLKYDLNEYLEDKNLHHNIEKALVGLNQYNELGDTESLCTVEHFIKREIARLEGKDE